jgi:hypothetical protein
MLEKLEYQSGRIVVAKPIAPWINEDACKGCVFTSNGISRECAAAACYDESRDVIFIAPTSTPRKTFSVMNITAVWCRDEGRSSEGTFTVVNGAKVLERVLPEAVISIMEGML